MTNQIVKKEEIVSLELLERLTISDILYALRCKINTHFETTFVKEHGFTSETDRKIDDMARIGLRAIEMMEKELMEKELS